MGSKDFVKDCFAVEQAIDRIGNNYSINQLSELTKLPRNRVYSCWVSLLKKNKIRRKNSFSIDFKQVKQKRKVATKCWYCNKIVSPYEEFSNEHINCKFARKEGRLQGALGEVALMKLCIQNEGSWKGIQEHIEKRLKELKG